jgi:hypothetical protein
VEKKMTEVTYRCRSRRTQNIGSYLLRFFYLVLIDFLVRFGRFLAKGSKTTRENKNPKKSIWAH